MKKPRTVLSDDEIALIKGFIKHTELQNQTITAYFSTPKRSVNARLIKEVREGRYVEKRTAEKHQLEKFRKEYDDWFSNHPSFNKDELLDKAIETILAAIQIINNPISKFKYEVAVTILCMGWNHLCLAKLPVDKRRSRLNPNKTAGLSECIKISKLNLSGKNKKDLGKLVTLRNEVVHDEKRVSDDKDKELIHDLCLEFNKQLKDWFGEIYALDEHLSFAVTFQIYYQVAETVRISDSEDALIATEIIKYRPSDVVEKIKEKGWETFTMHQHTLMWKHWDAKNPNSPKKYGDFEKYGHKASEEFRWHDNWIDHIFKWWTENGKPEKLHTKDWPSKIQ